MQGVFRSDGEIDFGLITFVGYEEIDEMEKQFKTRWQRAEQENLRNLIKQSASETWTRDASLLIYHPCRLIRLEMS